MLKRTFGRFDEFADKWVTNDAWLVYEAAFDGFNAHLALIQQKQRLPEGATDNRDQAPAMA